MLRTLCLRMRDVVVGDGCPLGVVGTVWRIFIHLRLQFWCDISWFLDSVEGFCVCIIYVFCCLPFFLFCWSVDVVVCL